MDLSLLKDSGFWSAIVAFAALILSQFPPLLQYVKGKDLEIFLPEAVTVQHYLGNVSIYAFLDIRNIGGKAAFIDKINCTLIDEKGDKRMLPAFTYLSRQQPPQVGMPQAEYLVPRIFLKPDENWNETVRFARLWTDEEEDKVSLIVSKIRDDIYQKGSMLPPNSRTWVEADKSLVDSSVSFFNKEFWLHMGRYQIYFTVMSEDNSLIAMSGFEFILYDHQIKKLGSQIEGYKYGFGILSIDASKAPTVRLKPIGRSQAIETCRTVLGLEKKRSFSVRH